MTNNKAKEVLKKVRDNSKGLLSQSDLINCLPDRDTRLSHSLITSGFIEEVNRRIKANGQEATFYRLTQKGYLVFEPWWKRTWAFFTNDMAKILSIIAIIISILVGLKQMGWI